MILTEVLCNKSCFDSRSDDFLSLTVFCSLCLESINKTIQYLFKNYIYTHTQVNHINYSQKYKIKKN